jgi:hypothetical protein
MDLDTFFVSVERLRNRELEGMPLIIGGKGGRGVVASCSYEARGFGVHSAMPMRMALQLCPQAIVISGDMEAYSHYSGIITDIITEKAPLFEKSSIDEFYIDLTGMDRFFGCLQWARELRAYVDPGKRPALVGGTVHQQDRVESGHGRSQAQQREACAPWRGKKFPGPALHKKDPDDRRADLPDAADEGHRKSGHAEPDARTVPDTTPGEKRGLLMEKSQRHRRNACGALLGGQIHLFRTDLSSRTPLT